MARSGKKYNIWIAYSDLFSNLSTFLFVSALGMFAAFGSAMSSDGGLGARQSCVLTAEVGERLTAGQSMLKMLDPARAPSGTSLDCVEYFIIDGYRYQTNELNSFKDMTGSRPTRGDLLFKLCEPIWLALGSDAFVNADGRMTFVGAGEVNGRNASPTRCSENTPEGSEARLFPALRGRSDLSAIRECELTGTRAYNFCADVLICLKKPRAERNNFCRGVWAEVARGRQSERMCAKGYAERQARVLYDICTDAINDRSFPTHKLDDASMSALAAREDGRRELWNRVDTDELVRDGPLSGVDPAERPENRQPAGTILVKVSVAGTG